MTAVGMQVRIAVTLLWPGALLIMMQIVVVPAAESQYDGVDSIFALGLSGIVLVLWASGLWMLTIFVVVFAGLPLRVIPRAQAWWIANNEIAWGGALLGGGLLTLAWTLGSNVTYFVDGPGGYSATVVHFAPVFPLVVAGWLVLSFSLMHLWWPGRWRRRRKPDATPKVRRLAL